MGAHFIPLVSKNGTPIVFQNNKLGNKILPFASGQMSLRIAWQKTF